MTQTPAPKPGTATLRIQYGSSKDYGSFGTLTVVHPHAYSRSEARRLAITRTDVATGGGRAVTVTFPNGAAYRFTPAQLHGYGSRPTPSLPKPECTATRTFGPAHDPAMVGCDLPAGHDGDHRERQAYGRGSDVDLVWNRRHVTADTTPYDAA